MGRAAAEARPRRILRSVALEAARGDGAVVSAQTEEFPSEILAEKSEKGMGSPVSAQVWHTVGGMVEGDTAAHTAEEADLPSSVVMAKNPSWMGSVKHSGQGSIHTVVKLPEERGEEKG